VAAGGIMDGAGIAAVLALGAQAAQLGTAFIPCPESGASQVHKESLLRAREDETQITEKFSGKAARGLANRFMREMEDKPQLAFPPRTALPASSARLAPRRASRFHRHVGRPGSAAVARLARRRADRPAGGRTAQAIQQLQKGQFMHPDPIVIVAAARTPMGAFQGS